MTRNAAIGGTVIFFFVAPGLVEGLLPWLLSGGWQFRTPFPGYGIVRVVGAIIIVGGFAALLASFARFALVGRGTPAPVAPTERLIVGGFYRYVRNPMYIAALSTILGQALFFGSLEVFLYFVVLFLLVHLFVLLYEEPTMRRTYGAEYDAFAAAVPSWLPRTTPWEAHP